MNPHGPFSVNLVKPASFSANTVMFHFHGPGQEAGAGPMVAAFYQQPNNTLIGCSSAGMECRWQGAAGTWNWAPGITGYDHDGSVFRIYIQWEFGPS
jgi:hypothetical protein